MLLLRGATACAPAARQRCVCALPQLCKSDRRPVRRPRAAGGGGSDAAAAAEDAQDAAAAAAEFPGALSPCMPAFVVADNSHHAYSAFTIEVQDYPGLLRVVTWVMNGLGCRVHNAVLRTSEDGLASDVFWVTDLRGRKLSDADAADVADRLEEFVSYCAPPVEAGTPFSEFTSGDISVSNLAHPQWTEVTFNADLFSPGLLLEVASIFHGQGLLICEAVVRGGSESPIPPELQPQGAGPLPDPQPGKRVMRFWVKEGKTGGKLDFADVSALLYTLRVVLGDGGLPMRPPNTEVNSLMGLGALSSLSESDEAATRPGALAGRSAGTAKGRVRA